MGAWAQYSGFEALPEDGDDVGISFLTFAAHIGAELARHDRSVTEVVEHRLRDGALASLVFVSRDEGQGDIALFAWPREIVHNADRPGGLRDLALSRIKNALRQK